MAADTGKTCGIAVHGSAVLGALIGIDACAEFDRDAHRTFPPAQAARWSAAALQAAAPYIFVVKSYPLEVAHQISIGERRIRPAAVSA